MKGVVFAAVAALLLVFALPVLAQDVVNTDGIAACSASDCAAGVCNRAPVRKVLKATARVVIAPVRFVRNRQPIRRLIRTRPLQRMACRIRYRRCR